MFVEVERIAFAGLDFASHQLLRGIRTHHAAASATLPFLDVSTTRTSFCTVHSFRM